MQRPGRRRRDADTDTTRGEAPSLDRATADRLLSDVLESTDTQLAVVDERLIVITANLPFRNGFGGGLDPSGHPLGDLTGVAGTSSFVDLLEAVRCAVTMRTEVRLYARDDIDSRTRWLDVTATPLPSNPGAIVRARDVSDLVEAARIVRSAPTQHGHDGVLPPGALPPRLQQAMQQGTERVRCVAELDIDQFSVVRTALGDQGAAELAQQVIAAVRRHLPPGGDLGTTITDSYLFTFPAGDEMEIDRAVSAIRDAVRQPVTVRGRTMRVTASLGYTVVTGGSIPDAAHALAEATAAMQLAARRGGNRCMRYSTESSGTPEGMLRLWNELRSALQFRQMEVWFQPIVSLADGRPLAAEALCRWHHPQLGDVAPTEFIRSAERNSEIINIGSFVHDRAAQVMRALRADSSSRLREFQLSINAAPDELAWPQFASSLLARLEANEVRPEWFALEVSERSLESGDEAVGINLAAVAAAGVTIVLDDFGTSLASLPRLVDLGVRRAKLQRSLVAAMVDDPRVDHIVASLLALATALGLDTVAGGVESDATVRRLRELGCRSAQGYLFSPAIPEIELSSVLRDLATNAH